MFLEKARAGPQPLGDERAHENRRARVSRNTESEGGDEVRARDGAVGGFRGRDALVAAVAVLFGFLGSPFRRRVAHEGGDGRSRARNRTDEGAYHGRAHDGARRMPYLDDLEFPAASKMKGIGRAREDGSLFFRLYEHLAHGEKPDEQGNHPNPFGQSVKTEREALPTRDDVRAHHAELESDEGRQHALHQGGARHAGDDGQPHEQESEKLGRPEQERHSGQRKRRENQYQIAESIADGGGVERHLDRAPRLSFLRERKPVHTRRRRRRGSRRVHQYGGDGASEKGSLVNPQQEGNAQHGRHEKGEGNQDCRRHHARKPRNSAHRDAHEDAQRYHGDTLPRERHHDSLEYLFEHTRPN